ncbi:MFS transporter [Saccharococcus caldoxylosilyticus]|uniref:Putative drug resistance transporter n=1 Tax=Parageobacillus caldoxylosilyticus NBRC 107762 TaxID=1220594 RepID=A0A023DJC7_9BACL|nr:MFS transporter [Parageobacillus caldoxylosilyticus]MBB3852114.1 MFS family permease [Parageobacillus caldoxylosilyticus]BDG42008.1 multidrug resistance protein [Parageobacillus caldoxylosilyticus]GAJ41362.1 putative drug resistance transporter [Parageobacillus caldoxylosilyticus NBRC 107762]
MEERRQTRARWITVFATFLAFMGIGIVDPILPVIAKSIGATHWQVEMLFTAYIFTMAIMMIPSGMMVSRIGDKRMMAIGLSIVTVVSLLCGLSNTIPQLSIFRAGWGLGNSMFFATAMTLLIALTPQANTAVGLYEAAIGLGMAGGPLVGGLLGQHSWRYPFIGTSIFIFIALLLVVFFVYDPNKGKPRKAVGMKEMQHLLTFPPFLKGAIGAMLYYYGFFVVLAYSPLIIGLSAIQIGFVFFGWGLCLAYGSAILSHHLEKTYTTKQILPYSLLVFAVFLLLLFITKNTWLLIAFIILSGLVSGLNNALFTSYVMEASPYERGITSGMYNFVRWMGAAIAPVLSGIIGHSVSDKAPFMVAMVLSFIAFAFLIIRKQQPSLTQTN